MGMLSKRLKAIQTSRKKRKATVPASPSRENTGLLAHYTAAARRAADLHRRLAEIERYRKAFGPEAVARARALAADATQRFLELDAELARRLTGQPTRPNKSRKAAGPRSRAKIKTRVAQ